MSSKKTKKNEPSEIPENKMLEISMPANLGSEVLRVQDEMKRFTDNIGAYQETFKLAYQGYQQFVQSVYSPLYKLAETLQSIGAFQTRLAEDIQKAAQIQSSVIQGLINYQSIAENLVIKSGILDVVNSFRGLQIEAFSGLMISSELEEKVSSINNGISEISTIRNTRMMAGGVIKVGIDKNTSSPISAQVTYRKLEIIDTRVQLLNQELVGSNQRIEILERNQKKFQEKIENNPFPFFKIKNINFLSQNSQLLVNGEIVVEITPYSLMEDLCNVLFSGRQKLGELWFFDSIQESWATPEKREEFTIIDPVIQELEDEGEYCDGINHLELDKYEKSIKDFKNLFSPYGMTGLLAITETSPQEFLTNDELLTSFTLMLIQRLATRRILNELKN